MWAGEGGVVKLPTCLKLVGIMLETWHVSTDTYVVSENIAFISKTLLILLMSAFFLPKISVFGQNSTFTQSNSVRAVFEIF